MNNRDQEAFEKHYNEDYDGDFPYTSIRRTWEAALLYESKRSEKLVEALSKIALDDSLEEYHWTMQFAQQTLKEYQDNP